MEENLGQWCKRFIIRTKDHDDPSSPLFSPGFILNETPSRLNSAWQGGRLVLALGYISD